ncbi:high mobility group B protein 3-like [Amaranthus tricolor]|uniref:high mobility group B protein 3-like n=1 Tax=Amaranthus tricolor TaxID=29722 RepID=UPI002588F4BA|nr:high mobility group B protein 3-like [Amaranthus tricolor]
MATRKRVRAFRYAPPPLRAPDGSAFMNCEKCGVSVAIALMDMHDCKRKKDVKKFKGNSKPSIPEKILISEQPRSPFMFFMESYSKSCKSGQNSIEVNREAVEKWKKMSTKERWPYILQAQKVDMVYMNILRQEEIQLSQDGDDEADSAKGTQYGSEYSDDYDSEESEGWNNLRCQLHKSCFCIEVK